MSNPSVPIREGFGGGGGSKPTPLVGPGAPRFQPPRNPDPVDPSSVPAGGTSPLPAVTPSADPGNPLGAGSLGSGEKPFRVKGA